MLVSIIVAAKNAEKTIFKCVSSLLAVDYPEKEIIVVDDGSKDSSGIILEKFKNQKIKIIKTEGIGPSAARNMAIGKSSGDYIAFTDSDCIVDKDFITELLK